MLEIRLPYGCNGDWCVCRLEEREPKAGSELREDKLGGLSLLEDLPAPVSHEVFFSDHSRFKELD